MTAKFSLFLVSLEAYVHNSKLQWLSSIQPQWEKHTDAPLHLNSRLVHLTGLNLLLVVVLKTNRVAARQPHQRRRSATPQIREQNHRDMMNNNSAVQRVSMLLSVTLVERQVTDSQRVLMRHAEGY